MFSFNQSQEQQNTPFFQDNNQQKPSLFNTQYTQSQSAFELFNQNETSALPNESVSFKPKDNGRDSKKSIIMELDEFDRNCIFRELQSNMETGMESKNAMQESRVVKFGESQNQGWEDSKHAVDQHQQRKNQDRRNSGFGQFKVDLNLKKNNQKIAQPPIFGNIKQVQKTNINVNQNGFNFNFQNKNKKQDSSSQLRKSREQFSFQIKPSKQKLLSNISSKVIKKQNQTNQNKSNSITEIKPEKQNNQFNITKPSLLNKIEKVPNLQSSNQKQISESNVRMQIKTELQLQPPISVKPLLNSSVFQMKIKDHKNLNDSKVELQNSGENRQNLKNSRLSQSKFLEKINFGKSELKLSNSESKNTINFNFNIRKQSQDKELYSKTKQEARQNVKKQKPAINFGDLLKKSLVKSDNQLLGDNNSIKEKTSKDTISNHLNFQINVNSVPLNKPVKSETALKQKPQQPTFTPTMTSMSSIPTLFSKPANSLSAQAPQLQFIPQAKPELHPKVSQFSGINLSSLAQPQPQKVKEKPFLNLKLFKDQIKNDGTDKKIGNGFTHVKDSQISDKRDGVFTAQMFKDSTFLNKGMNFHSFGNSQSKKSEKNQGLSEPKERTTQKIIKLPLKIDKKFQRRQTQKLPSAEVPETNQDSPQKVHKIDYESIENELLNLHQQLQQTKRKSLKSDESIKSIFLLLNKANITLSQRFMSQTSQMHPENNGPQQKNK